MAFVPTLDLHEHTLPGLLRRNAERLPDNDCIVRIWRVLELEGV